MSDGSGPLRSRSGPRSRLVWLVVFAAVVMVGVRVALWWLAPTPPRRTDVAAQPGPVAAPPPAEPGVSREPSTDEAVSRVPEPAPDPDAEIEADLRGPWAAVDLEEVRRAMPDNTYWRLGVPTRDPRVLEAREQERAHWNVEYGKVLSGTATEQEIQAYFDYRHRLSADYVEFAEYLLDHYGDQLPERDTRLLELATRLHLARLEEIPRKTEEALERKRKQDAARAAWLADQAAFGKAEKPADGAD
jgi:hypothetical protein